MKHLIDLNEFYKNAKVDYVEIIGLNEVQETIQEEIFQIELSGTYKPKKIKALDTELKSIKRRLIMFYN